MSNEIKKTGQFNNSFLLDEVRCGFYIPSEIKQAWAAQLEVLQAVDEVCSKNNISYFADWGTLLGVVRHRGFIPWDDDIDIVMKREDYEKFRQVENELPEGFSIHTFRNEEGFREFHATVVGAPSVCFEKEHLRKFHGFPYMCGLDIFILDYVYADEKKEEERIYNIKYVIAIADAIEDGGMPQKAIDDGLLKIEKLTGKKIDKNLDKHQKWIKLYEIADMLCASVKECESDTLTQMIPWGIIGKKFRFPKEYYKESIRLPFEYTFLPVPIMYNKMLSKRYGIYTKLVKTAGGHDYPFFEKQRENLKSLIDFEMPGYRYGSENLNLGRNGKASDGWKRIIRDVLPEWKELAQTSVDSMQGLVDTQQTIIDIGNLIEQIKGRDCIAISCIEKFCESVYGLYSAIENNLDERIRLIEEYEKDILLVCDSIERVIDRKEVLFVVAFSKHWSNIRDKFLEETADENTDVYVMPVPYFYKDYDGAPIGKHCEANEFDKELPLVDYSTYEIGLHHPDRIYIQEAADEFNDAYGIDRRFHSRELLSMTDELIYVPWIRVTEFNENDRAYQNLKHYACVPGSVIADKIILRDENVAYLFAQKLYEWSEEVLPEIWLGKIKINTNKIVSDSSLMEKDSDLNKRLIYYIGIGQYIEEAEYAIGKMQNNLKCFADSSSKIAVTIAVEKNFPDILRNRSEESYKAFTQVIDEYSSNRIELKYIEDFDSVDSIVNVFDAYYGDAGFLVPEFVLAEKPVMIQSYNV